LLFFLLFTDAIINLLTGANCRCFAAVVVPCGAAEEEKCVSHVFENCVYLQALGVEILQQDYLLEDETSH
jgi:hypothetical protein